MIRYVLHQDLSYCRIGGRLVLLDIGGDRYFQLPCPMEQVLAAYLDGGGHSKPDPGELIERGILVEQARTDVGRRPNLKPAVRSTVEAPRPSRSLRASEFIEVFAIVVITRLNLKTSTLKSVLNRLAGRRPRVANGSPHPELLEQRISEAAAAFRQARLYVPIDMRCLLDSVAMARFLHRRGLRSHVVFGVALDPFSAHCWVQAEDLVLNDTVGNVASHTPIRVV